MMKYNFYVITSQIGVEEKGNTQEDVGTNIHMDLIVHTGKPTGIETTHPIRLGFSLRITQTEF